MDLRGLPAFVQQVKMVWQWKSCRKADFAPEGHGINTGIREKRAWLCIQASHAAIYIITPWKYKDLLWMCTHSHTQRHTLTHTDSERKEKQQHMCTYAASKQINMHQKWMQQRAETQKHTVDKLWTLHLIWLIYNDSDIPLNLSLPDTHTHIHTFQSHSNSGQQPSFQFTTTAVVKNNYNQ